MEKQILVVGATAIELAGLIKSLGGDGANFEREAQVEWNGIRVNFLCAGFGMVNTAYYLGQLCRGKRFDWAIQVGIGGSFPGGPEVGSSVEIREECYADLGAESPAGFLSLEKMGFPNFSYKGKTIYNSFSNPNAGKTGLPLCKGITVNKVHGLSESISEAEQLWKPEVESMEGAAFMQVCLLENISFSEIRGISNKVEVRNRSSWKIPEGLKAAQTAALEFLKQMSLTDRKG